MSEQRDRCVSGQLRSEELLDGFCVVCGHELYEGDPPIYAICQNPNCFECDTEALYEDS